MSQMLQRFLALGLGVFLCFSEYVPTTPGLLRLEVEQRTGAWKTQLPIRVER